MFSINARESNSDLPHTIKNSGCIDSHETVFERCTVRVRSCGLDYPGHDSFEQQRTNQDYRERNWSGCRFASGKNFFNPLGLPPVDWNRILLGQTLHLSRQSQVVLAVFRFKIIRAFERSDHAAVGVAISDLGKITWYAVDMLQDLIDLHFRRK